MSQWSQQKQTELPKETQHQPADGESCAGSRSSPEKERCSAVSAKFPGKLMAKLSVYRLSSEEETLFS